MELFFYAGVEYQGSIFFSASGELNGLFAMDIETGKVQFLKFFEEERATLWPHRAAFLYEGEAWFIPQEAQYIANVNLKSMEITYYEVPFHKKNELSIKTDYCTYISGHVVCDRYLCLVPKDIDAVLVIDMELHKMYPFYNVIDPEINLVLDGFVSGREMYLLPQKAGSLLKINMETNERTSLEWNYREYAFGSVSAFEEKVWFSPMMEDYIMCVDKSNSSMVKYAIPKPGERYCGEVCAGNKLIFLPFMAKHFLVFNTQTKKSMLVRTDESEAIFSEYTNKFTAIDSKDKIIITTGQTGHLVFWNKDADNYTITPLYISTACLYKQICKYVKVAWKNIEPSLFEMLRYLIQREHFIIENMELFMEIIELRCCLQEYVGEEFSRDRTKVCAGDRIWNYFELNK